MLALLGPRRRDLPFLSVQPLLYLRAPSLFVDTTHTVALSHACSAVSFLFSFNQKPIITSQHLNHLLLDLFSANGELERVKMRAAYDVI
jgi:hypothetical protein